MTINPMEITLRAKKLGVLLRDARKATCRTVEECATLLGVSESEYQAFELGEESPSLPQLELLAFYLKIPVEHFWSDKLLPQEKERLANLDLQLLIGLRQRIIGATIRKMRQERQLTLSDFSSRTGIPAETLEAYELGKRSIPFAELESLAASLGFPIKEFMDRHGPIGSAFMEQRSVREFQALSPELRDFVTKPVNYPYIELARRLSEMNVERLRSIAETILEITL